LSSHRDVADPCVADHCLSVLCVADHCLSVLCAGDRSGADRRAVGRHDPSVGHSDDLTWGAHCARRQNVNDQ
jgi:hypothetical protein